MCSDLLWGPPSLLSSGVLRVISSGVIRPGREADHAPPSSAEVKNSWDYISRYLKNKDTFNLLFILLKLLINKFMVKITAYS